MDYKFYCLLTIFAILSIISFANGAPSLIPVFFVAFGIVTWFVTGTVVVSAIWEHPGLFAAAALLYFTAGIFVAFWKWHLFVLDRIRKLSKADLLRYEREKADFKHGGDFNEYAAWHGFGPPQISQHKSEFAVWWMWWPFTLADIFLNDAIRRLVRQVYELFHRSLQSMANRMFDRARARVLAEKSKELTNKENQR